MNADTYLKHHTTKQIWKHYGWPRHQFRFKFCSDKLKGKTFIDVGCLFGHSTDILSKLCLGIWSGIDFTEVAIIRARKLFPNIVFYYSQNFNLLPICGMYDSVVCSEVLEHVSNDKALVDGVMQITKQIAVFSTPCKKVNDPGHLRVYTKESLQELFSAYDYVIEKQAVFFFITVRNKYARIE